jgi:ACS family pantothenate transporter-like MFS transporter
MITDYTWGFMSDLTQNRPHWITGPLLFTTVIGSSILTASPEADAPKIAGFFLVSGGYVTATTWVRIANKLLILIVTKAADYE